MKKVIRVCFLLLLMMQMLCMTSALADSVSQNGIDVTLSASKTEYASDEDVMVTLSVTNTSAMTLERVELKNAVPVGFSLKAGSADVKTVSQLKNAESASLISFFRYEPESESPATGDHIHFLWLFAVFAAAALAIGLIVKKYGRKMFMILLCVTIIGSVSFGTLQVANAQAMTRTITVTETVQYAGKEVKLTATVAYALADSNFDSGEISFASPTPEHVVHDTAEDLYYVDNQLLLTAKEGVSRADMETLIQELGGHTVGCIEVTGDYQVEFDRVMSKSELRQLTAKAAAYDFVESAELHELFETSFDAVPNDEKWASEEWSTEFPEGINWGVEAINAPGAWDYASRMSTVKVGIIDSMFDVNHEDLNFKKVWNNPSDLNKVDVKWDVKAHGTHVAGTMAATYNNGKGIAGVAPKVELYAYSMLGEATDPVFSDTNKSLFGLMNWKYAISLLVTSNCRVINVSMELGKYDLDEAKRQRQTFDLFLTKLRHRSYDFLIVQSAGNESKKADGAGFFIGCISNKDIIIVVGSIYNKGSHQGGFFWGGDRIFNGYGYSLFSNWGERVDIVAPGSSIYSTVPYSKYEGGWRGTSQAAPHVSGTAAMCFAVNPALSAAKVKECICESVSTSVMKSDQTYGVLDAKAAVERALNEDGTYVEPTFGMVMGAVYTIHDGPQAVDAHITAYAQSISTTGIIKTPIALANESGAVGGKPDGGYELVLEPGTYVLEFYAEGYIPVTYPNVVVRENEVTYLDDVILLLGTVDDLQMGTITGQITDAVNGRALDQVFVEIFPGMNNITGIAPEGWQGHSTTTWTDRNGHYTFRIEEGAYTLRLSKDGYITGFINVVSLVNSHQGQNATLSPVQAANQYRIVLTWGPTPADLDSHLAGPLSGGGQFHTFYSMKRAYEGNTLVANLDLDDTSGYGPETTTIYVTTAGTYHYAVHDFTNRNSTSSLALGLSGAKVEVYRGSERLKTYYVPRLAGTVWHVFEMENGVIKDLNTMNYVSDPHDVCRAPSSDTRAPRSLSYYEDDKEKK